MCGDELPPHHKTRFKYCSACLPISRQQYEVERRLRRLAEDPDFDRRRDIWKKFRMRLEDFDALLEKQQGRCAICRIDEPKGKGSWHVDHDHDTNKIRSLLCHHCNLALGHMRDKPEICELAADYLTQVLRTGEPWRPV